MISVIMPAFNASMVIEKTLNDFAEQIYKDFELIVVNDGSEDDTAEVVNAFISRHGLPWLLVSQSNKGLSSARNKGFDLSRGEFVVFCDCDDHFDNDYLLDLYQTAITEKSDAVFCGFNLVDENNNFIRRVKGSKLSFTEEKTGPELLYRFLVKDKLAVQMGRVLFKAVLIRENNIRFDESLKNGEDQIFTAISLFYAGKVSCIDKILYHYVQWTGQHTRQSSNVFSRAATELNMFRKLNSFFIGKDVPRHLVDVIDRCKIPNAVIKDLSLCLRSGKEDIFWHFLKDSGYRKEIRKSQSMICFRMKPETWFKGFLLLHRPRIFYRHYLNRH